MCNDWNNEMSIIDNNNNVLAYIHIQDLAGEYPNFWVNSNGSITMIQQTVADQYELDFVYYNNIDSDLVYYTNFPTNSGNFKNPSEFLNKQTWYSETPTSTLSADLSFIPITDPTKSFWSGYKIDYKTSDRTFTLTGFPQIKANGIYKCIYWVPTLSLSADEEEEDENLLFHMRRIGEWINQNGYRFTQATNSHPPYQLVYKILNPSGIQLYQTGPYFRSGVALIIMNFGGRI